MDLYNEHTSRSDLFHREKKVTLLSLDLPPLPTWYLRCISVSYLWWKSIMLKLIKCNMSTFTCWVLDGLTQWWQLATTRLLFYMRYLSSTFHRGVVWMVRQLRDVHQLYDTFKNSVDNYNMLCACKNVTMKNNETLSEFQQCRITLLILSQTCPPTALTIYARL